MTDYKIGEYKCPKCGWVHIAIKREFAMASNYDIARLEKCFRCGAPSVGFIPAEPGDAPMLALLGFIFMAPHTNARPKKAAHRAAWNFVLNSTE